MTDHLKEEIIRLTDKLQEVRRERDIAARDRDAARQEKAAVYEVLLRVMKERDDARSEAKRWERRMRLLEARIERASEALARDET